MWKVNLSLLPKEITPEYIYDCTYEERKLKFDKVISLRENRRKQVVNKLKNLKLSNLENNKEPIEKYENMKLYYEILINSAKQYKNNRWCPPPICENLKNIQFFQPFKED